MNVVVSELLYQDPGSVESLGTERGSLTKGLSDGPSSVLSTRWRSVLKI